MSRSTTLVALVLLALAAVSLAQTGSSPVQSPVGNQQIVNSFRSIVPRWGYPTDISVVSKGISDEGAKNYAIGVAIQFAYGIVLAVLTVLVGVCFCFCRCCCNWCGGRDPEPEGYTKTQIWGTYALMLFFALAVAAFAAVGWYYNNQMSSSLVSDSGVVGNIVTMLGNTFFFLNGAAGPGGVQVPASADSGLTQSVVDMITSLNSSLATTIANTQGSLSTVNSTVANGVNGLLADITAVNVSAFDTTALNAAAPSTSSGWNNGGNYKIPNYVYALPVGTSQMTNQATTSSKPALTTMSNTVSSVQSSIVSAAGGIYDTIRSMIKSVADAAINTIYPNYDKVKNTYKSQAQDYDKYRNLAILVILVLPVTALLFMFCGCLCKGNREWAGCPFTCYYWVGYLASFIIFLMFSFHMLFAVIMSDGCAYVSTLDSNFAGVSSLQSNNVGAVLDSCMQNTSLTGVYNLSSSLGAISGITFPPTNVANAFNFPAITEFVKNTTDYKASDFGFAALDDDTSVLSGTNGVNTKCLITTYNSGNINTCTNDARYTTPQNDCVPACDKARFWFPVKTYLTNLKASSVSMNTTYYNLQATMRTTDDILNNQISGSVTTLINKVNTTISSLTCGFIGVAYRNLKTSFCVNFAASLDLIALCTFAIGILNFAVIVCSTILAKRMRAPMSDVAAMVVDLGPTGAEAPVSSIAMTAPTKTL